MTGWLRPAITRTDGGWCTGIADADHLWTVLVVDRPERMVITDTGPTAITRATAEMRARHWSPTLIARALTRTLLP